MRLFKVAGEWQDDTPLLERAIQVEIQEEGPGVYVGEYVVPVSRSLAEYPQSLGPPQTAPLLAAHVNLGDPLRLFQAPKAELDWIRRGNYNGPCLVHVNLPQLEGCPLRYCASTYSELKVDFRSGPRVERQYHEFSQAVGVHVLVESGEETLLELLPGASFRLHRAYEQLPEGESPVLVVSWSGRELRVFRPTKFKNWKNRPPQRHRPIPINDEERAAAV